MERTSARNASPLLGRIAQPLARPPNVVRAEALRSPTLRDPVEDRRIGLLTCSRDLAQDTDENLGLGKSISRTPLDLLPAHPRVWTLAAVHDHRRRKQTSRGDHAPEPGCQPQLRLDHEVGEIMRQRPINTVMGKALQPNEHPIVATSQREVPAPLIPTERNLHDPPAYPDCTELREVQLASSLPACEGQQVAELRQPM